ncbi:MAG: cyclic-phosphate processing receiver domain-containing protein [Elusimicrobiota bacterium]
MKILFFDDMENRHIKFRQQHSKDEIKSAFTAKQAISILNEHSPFNEVHLDHDIGGVYMPSDKNSGLAVAEYISNMEKYKIPDKVIIHSLNKKGAEKMYAKLEEANINVEYSPFSQ